MIDLVPDHHTYRQRYSTQLDTIRTDIYHDPYLNCERRCPHDVAAGALVTDLLTGDGPHRGAVLQTLNGAIILPRRDIA